MLKALLLPLFVAGFQSSDIDPKLIAATANAALECVMAAGREGADVARFDDKTDWAKTEDGYRHTDEPVAIVFPQDEDGVARNCEVHSTLASRNDQRELLSVLEILLKKEPIKQTDSQIWMIDTTTGPRGLQVFPDYDHRQPEIRFIGAAF